MTNNQAGIIATDFSSYLYKNNIEALKGKSKCYGCYLVRSPKFIKVIYEHNINTMFICPFVYNDYLIKLRKVK